MKPIIAVIAPLLPNRAATVLRNVFRLAAE